MIKITEILILLFFVFLECSPIKAQPALSGNVSFPWSSNGVVTSITQSEVRINSVNLRDNNGILEWKNAGGEWTPVGTGTGVGGGIITPTRQVTVNAFMHMDVIDVDGTTLTTSILNTGTNPIGESWGISTDPITGFTVGPHRIDKYSEVLISGMLPYPITQNYKSLAFNHSQTGRTAIYYPPANQTKLTVAGYITFGPPNISPSGDLYDYLCIFDALGNYSALQLNNGTSPITGGYGLNIETNVDGTVHSDFYPITPGGTYYVSLNVDFSLGTTELYIYDAYTHTQLAHLTNTISSGSTIGFVKIGQNEWATAAGYISYFEHFMLDWSEASSPLGP